MFFSNDPKLVWGERRGEKINGTIKKKVEDILKCMKSKRYKQQTPFVSRFIIRGDQITIDVQFDILIYHSLNPFFSRYFKIFSDITVAYLGSFWGVFFFLK